MKSSPQDLCRLARSSWKHWHSHNLERHWGHLHIQGQPILEVHQQTDEARLPKGAIWRFPWNPTRSGRSRAHRSQQQDVLLQGWWLLEIWTSEETSWTSCSQQVPSEHLEKLGRASQRLECWLPLEEQQELLLQGRHFLEIQWKGVHYWLSRSKEHPAVVVWMPKSIDMIKYLLPCFLQSIYQIYVMSMYAFRLVLTHCLVSPASTCITNWAPWNLLKPSGQFWNHLIVQKQIEQCKNGFPYIWMWFNLAS